MTISKSNFIVISITLVTILFLFQFTNLSAIYTSKATINSNAVQKDVITSNQTVQSQNLIIKNNFSTAIIGNSQNGEADLAAEWCVYTKRTYYRFSTLEDYYDNFSTRCRLLVVNSDTISSQKDIKMLEETASQGINVIFTSLPDVAIIESSSTLQKLLGIQTRKNNFFKTNGITFYEGFLLGGKTTYHKLKKEIPYYKLESGTKTYAIGEVKNQKKKHIKNEDLPPVIWRNSYKNTFIFAVNTDFFRDHTGLGILTAMWSDTNSYYLYPIVNAQSIICQNYPYLANENTTQLQKKYYYSTKSFCENVLWPDIVSILNSTGDKFTGILAPELEYSDKKNTSRMDSLTYFFKQTEKISGELGISGDQMETTSYYKKKLASDSSTLKKMVPNYIFTIFSPGRMPETDYKDYLDGTKKDTVFSSIRTIINQKEENSSTLLSFYNDDILSMNNTIDGFSHTDAEDLYFKSLETALGYSAVSLDFKRVLYPSGKKDEWTKLSKKLASSLDTYWSTFRKSFEQVTVSKADTKTRQFLAVNYSTYRHSNIINLSLTNFHKQASFILNLSNETITSISGGSYVKIEKDRYVITASSADITIEVNADAN